jgi:hypothetical protein
VRFSEGLKGRSSFPNLSHEIARIGVQIFDKVASFSLNRDISKLNRDKLRRELAQPLGQGQNDIPQITEELFRWQVHIREAENIYDRIEPIETRKILSESRRQAVLDISIWAAMR